MKYKFIHIIIISIATCILSSCYQEQHFDMPGPYDEREMIPDTMPFPFDTTRQAGMWLIKDGVPDYSKVTPISYTDFKPEFGDTVLWEEKDGAFTLKQCLNFYPIDNKDHFGRDVNSYSYSWFYVKPFVKFAQGSEWYFYAKMSLPYIYGTASCFTYGGNGGWGTHNTVGLDAGREQPQFFADVDGQTIHGEDWPTFLELVRPGEPFELELVCIDFFVYVKVNGVLVFYYNLPTEEYNYPISYRPWRNSVSFYDIYMEGDIEEMYDFVCHEEEKDYRTIQAPALTKASNGDVLLFAEARVFNNELTSNADHARARSNATDIVMKRSSDGGDTWSELTAIVGERNSVNISPMVITDKDNKHYLLYTKDESGHLDGSTFDIYQITSTDNGNSWSNPQKINSTLQEDYTQRTISGHGVELKKGTHAGRLVAITSCVKSGVKTLATIYSDTDGATWESGSVVDATTIKGGNIVELSDGRLMLIMSHDGIPAKCQLAYSSDGGATWSIPVDGTLSTGSKGSRFSGSTVSTADGKIIHFTPSSNVSKIFDGLGRVIGNPEYGVGLGVTISSDDGTNWSDYESIATQPTYRVHSFLCKSMDAVILNDGRVLCITEGGMRFPKEGLVCFYK